MFTTDGPGGWSITAPGNVIRSWSTSTVPWAWGVGTTDKVWLSNVSCSGSNCANYEFDVLGNATGRTWTTPWAGAWPADMAYDSARNAMCQVNVGGDNGIYCWNPDTGSLVGSITGSFPWTYYSQRGLAYRPDDDSFYIGNWNEGVIYHIKGLSHADKGAVIDQCYAPDYAISGLAWNQAAGILWEATNSWSDTIYEVAYAPNNCTVLTSLPHPNPYYNGAGIEMDQLGNLWVLSQNAHMAYLMESGVPNWNDVKWLSEEPVSGTLAPGANQDIQVTFNTAGMLPGVYNANLFITTNGAKTATIRVPVSLIVSRYMQGINAGGKLYTDVLGDPWAADKQWAAGSWGFVNKSTTASTKSTIKGTTDPKLYQDLRDGVLEYRFDGVPNGVCQIELLFAEIRPTQPGRRMFDVLIEGNTVIHAHDIALDAGSLTADKHTFYVAITDGQVNVRFVPQRSYGTPIINAVRVIQRPDR